MNKENLQRMADHIRTIPQEMFDMAVYRAGDKTSPECNSVGCVIGHCTALDIENIIEEYINQDTGNIDFIEWSDEFTGFIHISEFRWCFDSFWKNIDNTPEGAALRIEWLIRNGLPKKWKEQIHGKEPLCYR